MIIKTRSLTEGLEKLYEAYEYELDDELDAIMGDDELSDDEKEAEIEQALEKHDKMNESFVREWWGQIDDDPYELEDEYGLTVKKIGRDQDSTLYEFSGPRDAIKAAMRDGYFYSVDYGEDEGHSEDLDEALNEEKLEENPAVVGAVTRAVAPVLADAAIDKVSDEISAKLSESTNEKDVLTEVAGDGYGMEYYVGNNETGHMYYSMDDAVGAVKHMISFAQNTPGCALVSISIVPTDGGGNDL